MLQGAKREVLHMRKKRRIRGSGERKNRPGE
jgi:hypothetical protein